MSPLANNNNLDKVIAVLALLAILGHLFLRFLVGAPPLAQALPLYVCLFAGGLPLVIRLAGNIIQREFGSDLLAGISIVTSVFLGEYLAGSIVVLMLSGGSALEQHALNNASSVLRALARRMPALAHRKEQGGLKEVAVESVLPDDILVIFPHEVCPVDGIVTEGASRMDESFLTGEPFQMQKARGTAVISGSINGESPLTIRATKRAVDSRYAQIMQVMEHSAQTRPKMRRLADQLGAWYTPLALLIALAAWIISGEPIRFLAVLVVATPCPLLLAIPIAIIGAISLAARHGIIVRDPAILEQLEQCRTIIFDKTGTLTYGRPRLTAISAAPGFDDTEVLRLAASLEVYSKHPLAKAILDDATERALHLSEAMEISEPPGAGLRGTLGGKRIEITSRKKLQSSSHVSGLQHLPPTASGLECVVIIDDCYAATLTFHDAPREEGLAFIRHLGPNHRINKIMIVSGDRESEVRYLADQVGIAEVHAQKDPGEKVAIVRAETQQNKTLYVGDGINDAPAMMTATIGVAIGNSSDVTTQAAGATVLTPHLRSIDQFMHIGRRMRRIALQSAVGGLALSVIAMFFAAAGFLAPVAGALLQEAIDVLSIANALRTAFPAKHMSDF